MGGLRVMNPFDLSEPATLREAVGMLDSSNSQIRPVAGGTAVMLMMKTGIFQPERLISLHRIEKRYSRIAVASNGDLRIGAMTPLRRLEQSADVENVAPVITQALRRLSNVRVRNVATLGGHLAHGDPHLDLPPVLIALGASVVIAGPSGERKIDVDDLYRGYLETTLAHDELIAEIVVPARPGRRAAYLKHTTRSADDWPALGIAVALERDGTARVVIGAATDTPRRLESVEAVLSGGGLDDRVLLKAGDAAASEAQVHSDARGSAAYKTELIRVFTPRAIRQAAGRVG